MNTQSDTIIYNYMDTFFCCHVEKDKLCEEMITDHMLVYICSGEMVFADKRKTHHFQERGFRIHETQSSRKKDKTADQKRRAIQRTFLQLRTPLLKSLMTEAKFPISTNFYAGSKDRSYTMLTRHPFLTGLFMSLEQYFDSQKYPSNELMTTKLKEAALVLLEVEPSLASVLFDFAEPWKTDLAEFMNKNYKYDLSLQEFAHYTGRSLTSFKRDFASIFNEPPGRWLVKKRLHDAYNQIVNKNQKPSEVYQEVGFKNLSHFSTAFKKEFGYPPSNKMDFQEK